MLWRISGQRLRSGEGKVCLVSLGAIDKACRSFSKLPPAIRGVGLVGNSCVVAGVDFVMSRPSVDDAMTDCVFLCRRGQVEVLLSSGRRGIKKCENIAATPSMSRDVTVMPDRWCIAVKETFVK